MIPQAPELFDGGWWVAVPVIEDEDGLRPDVDADAWAAWYGEGVAYVRTLEPVVTTHPGPVEIKGYARIGGR